jgi:uncharacterized membrane protein
MENQNIKSYQFVLGLGLVLLGILIFSFLSDPVRYLGFVFIIGAAIYFANVSSSKIMYRNKDEKFRSRTRDQILKHQHKVHR